MSCKNCNDTGKNPGSDYLDCAHCDAATNIAAGRPAVADYDELQKLAEAATDGPWAVGETYIDREEDGTMAPPETVVRGMDMRAAVAVCLDFGDNNPAWRDANAAFIAAASPAAIKELLSELTTLRAAARAPKAELPAAAQQNMELVIARLERIASGTNDAREAAEQALPCARAVLAQAAPVAAETAEYKRMLEDACLDLARINEAVGADPEVGGAGPIIEAIDAMKAKLAAPVAVPEGCRLVPKRATAAMIDAYNDVPTGIAGSPAHGQHVWVAMLAAAPAAPVAAAVPAGWVKNEGWEPQIEVEFRNGTQQRGPLESFAWEIGGESEPADIVRCRVTFGAFSASPVAPAQETGDSL